jgi:hypothetical protein
MRWIIRIYALVLLAYTGWRTYDFMINQLPQGDTSTLLALLFLFATEVGLALWHEISMNHANTREQQALSTALTWLDLAGSLAAGVADMIIRQTISTGYTIPALLAQFLIYGLPLAVALNVAGVLLYLSNDSEIQIDRAKKQLRFEITRQALRELRDNQGAIAEGMKRDIFKQLRDDVTGKIIKEYLREANRIPLPSGNGHQHPDRIYPAETEEVTRPNGLRGE